MIKKHIIIPARIESQRLPGKVLLDISGKPMIQRVYETCLECNYDSVTIATDSDEIKNIALGFGASVCMTSSNHKSGTDRIAEAVSKLSLSDDDIIVNVQGDEPLIPKENIIQVTKLLEKRPLASVATLSEKINENWQISNINCVKVISDKLGYAIYFSRLQIPYKVENKMLGDLSYYRHIGLYSYRGKFLSSYLSLNSCMIEQSESLEQLRVLWHGYKIAVETAILKTPPGVDTQANLDYVRSKFNNIDIK